MGLRKYGTGDGRILKDKKTAEAKKEWTQADQDALVEEQADAMEQAEE